jgi:hypothetical protein
LQQAPPVGGAQREAQSCALLQFAAWPAWRCWRPAPRRQENYESWPVLKSTFPSTGGNGIMIKGYDPVITGGKCVTTFMAVEPGADPKVYPNVIEFETVSVQGGTLCQNGKWRAFDGGATGTTPFRVFFKDGVFRGSP